MIGLNGTTLEFATFPNGETRVNGEQILRLADSANGANKADNARISFKYENDGDLVKLLFVKSFLDERRIPASLIVYYMPYSRMDRVEGDSVFTLKYVAGFINAMNFIEVTLVEPHSDVSLALIDRSRAKYPTIELLERVIRDTGFRPEADYLFFPDAGAQKRYAKLKGFRQLVGFKARDFRTGRIERLDVIGGGEAGVGNGFKAIIVDDLCSYGGTFMLSAEKLRELGAAEVYLLVGHCEPSIFQGQIPHSDFINRVYTTNSLLDDSPTDKIVLYDIGGM